MPDDPAAKSIPDSVGFDELVALIDEELRSQIAVGRLGEIDPPAPAVHSLATLVADVVQRVYRLERRVREDAS